ncbi:Crp/Fnr family transcriptional regulator [Arcticibacter sp.]|jgi:CRP-like cAMP-binding protein|uniref:Crp/Fnr family transcriptional regulator n=1 Tax=Arcticibacter sp. TaxID=1872630 RepID=UPI00388FF591
MRSHSLIQKLNEFCALPDEIIPQIVDAFKVIELPKEKTVLREGFTNRNVYFLKTGIVRRYHISQVGHQKTTGFITDNTFFTDLDSFERRKGSSTTFNTESTCTIYSIDYFKLHGLMDAIPTVREAFIKMKDYYSNIAIETKHFLETAPVESRVKKLVEELPSVIESCRKRDIISFLRTNSQTYNFILKSLLPPGKK